MSHKVLFLATAVFASLAIGANAASIGVQFLGVNGGGATYAVGASESAGVVPQINYNVMAGPSNTNAALNDDTATLTSATLTTTGWNAQWNSQSSQNAAGIPSGPDEKLNRGGIFQTGGQNNTTTVSSIPYALYDVYVYPLYDSAGIINVTLTPLAGTPQSVFGANPTPNGGAAGYVDGNPNTAFTYIQGTGATSGTANAGVSYFKFSGLTASSFSFNVQVNAANPALDGFQIVEVPEPGSLVLLGMGALMMVPVMRKRLRRNV